MVIYLVGFMGCGKSTLGKPLAHKLLYDFVDMDSYIEDIEGLKISEIFEIKGEPYFRQLEREALEQLSERHNIVVSTGGGVAAFDGNIEYMNSKGLSIYLKMNSGTLLSRLAHSSTERPIFAGKSRDEMAEIIDRMLAEREPFYNRASIIIDGMDIKVYDIIDKIKESELWLRE